MKKLIVLLSFLAVSFSSFAQFEYGAKVFMNASNVHNGFYQAKYADYNVAKIGYGFGLYGEFKNLIAPRVGLRGEILFNTVGERANFSKNYSNTLRLYYLHIPVLAEYKVMNDRLTFAAGPQFGFCLGGKEIFRNGTDKKTSVLHNREFNTLDVSFAFGVGYMVWKNVGIEARYNLGITNIYTNFGEPTGQNRFFTLGVTCKL